MQTGPTYPTSPTSLPQPFLSYMCRCCNVSKHGSPQALSLLHQVVLAQHMVRHRWNPGARRHCTAAARSQDPKPPKLPGCFAPLGCKVLGRAAKYPTWDAHMLWWQNTTHTDSKRERRHRKMGGEPNKECFRQSPSPFLLLWALNNLNPKKKHSDKSIQSGTRNKILWAHTNKYTNVFADYPGAH